MGNLFLVIFILNVLYRPERFISLNCGSAEQKAASPAEAAESTLLHGDWKNENE